MSRPSFLREMWPVLGLMRLLGWLPAHRRHDSGTLHVRPVWVVYSAVVLTIQLVPAIVLVINGVKATSLQDPHIRLMCYVFVASYGAPQVLPLFAALQAPSHVRFCNDLERFQSTIACLSGTPLRCGLSRLSRSVVALCLLFFVLTLVVRPIALARLPRFSVDIYVALFATNVALLVGTWLAAAKVICATARRLLHQYKLVLRVPDSSAVLSTRPLWLQLCGLVRGFGGAMSLAHGASLVLNFAFLLYVLYELLSLQELGPAIFFGGSVVVFTLGLVPMALCAHRVSTTVYQSILDAIFATKGIEINKNVKLQMVDFLVHVAQRSPEVTLSGYITVGRRLISTLVSALVTNLVVLLQLKIVEKSLTTQDFFTLSDFVTW